MLVPIWRDKWNMGYLQTCTIYILIEITLKIPKVKMGQNGINNYNICIIVWILLSMEIQNNFQKLF